MVQSPRIYPEVICRSVGLPEISLEGVEIKQLAKNRKRIVVKKVVKRQKTTGSVK